MNAFLLFKDKSLHPAQADDQLVKDLELACIIDHMADSDSYITETLSWVFAPDNLCRDYEEIRYRQEILRDCLNQPEETRRLYSIVTRAVKLDKSTFLSTTQKKAKYMLDVAVKVMISMQEPLAELYQYSLKNNSVCRSQGMLTLFEGLILLFAPDKLAGMKKLMEDLSPKDSISAAAVLGKRLRAEEYHPIRKSGVTKKGFLSFLKKDKNRLDFEVDLADQEASPAFNRLKDDLVISSASVVVRSRNELFDFLKELQRELSFYIGCLNLRDHMKKLGIPATFPETDRDFNPGEGDETDRDFSPGVGDETDRDFSLGQGAYLRLRDLYNLSLSLMSHKASVPNSLDCREKSMLIITGPNQGGKTTFLRSLGQALLMMDSGMFTASEGFYARPGRIYTHFIREEDKALKSGKLDEELLRMREITDSIRSGDWLLLNESFASTNEEEGSEIALEIITALYDQGVGISYVTHFYHLVRLLKEQREGSVVYLNALRDQEGVRSFHLQTGEPVVRGFGEDLYQEIFGKKGY